MIDVLDERADWIALEPPEEPDGVEFILVRNRVRQHHQCKRQTTRGLGWSISALDDSNVLVNIPAKLRGNTDQFHFVSMMLAPKLNELIENARQAEDFQAFQSLFLPVGERLHEWTDLTSKWPHLTKTECFELLKRTHITATSEEFLRNQVLSRIRPLVDGDDRQAANEIVTWALDSVHATLTADRIWNHLQSVGFPKRIWGNDPHVHTALEFNNRRFANDRKREFFRNLFPQPLADEAVIGLSTPGGPNILISAPAGGGKSALIIQVTDKLAENSIPYLAIRLDRLDPSLQTTNQIGRTLDLPFSPVSLLGAIAQGRRCVLILDQLDSLSSISGKNPNLYQPVCDMLEEATAYSEMRVLAACRAFDLQNDHRLKKICKEPGFKHSHLAPLNRDYVRRAVSEAGFDDSLLTEAQVRLLSNPLHLSLLAHISPSCRRPFNIQTSVELFEEFWARKLQGLGQSNPAAAQAGPFVDKLSELMETSGTLFVPQALLPDPIGSQLASHHVLIESDRNWSFFHESFYDFANAKRIYRLNKSIAAYLKEQRQGIRLRAQLRQSLAFRRTADPKRYRQDLAEIFVAVDLRFHLKHSAAAFLAEVSEPSTAEWSMLEPLANRTPPDAVSRSLINLIGRNPAWFRVAEEAGAISRWVNDPSPALRNLVAWVLIEIARKWPAGIVKSLREATTTANGTEVANTVVNHVDLGADRSIFELFAKSLDKRKFASHGQAGCIPWVEIYGIASNQPEWACEALGLAFRKAMREAAENRISNPFESGASLLNNDPMAEETLRRMQQGAPSKFLEELWPSVVSAVESNLARSTPPESFQRDEVWHFLDPGFKHELHEKILHCVEDAIRAVAKDNFQRFLSLSQSANQHFTIQYLLVAGFASASHEHPEEAIQFLIDDKRRLEPASGATPRDLREN